MAMREYESIVPGKYKIGIDPGKGHTMQQLQEVVANAIDKHSENDSNGLWGKGNGAFLKLVKNKERTDSLLRLFPCESEYMSVVCGGFKLILEAWCFPLYSVYGTCTDRAQAAGRFSKINAEILEAL